MSCTTCHQHDACILIDGAHRVRRVGLVGNPNVGKSTLFNALTGLRQRVGNYPGVTVERRVGRLACDMPVDIIDLPGLYSVIPHAADEEIAVRVLKAELPGEGPLDAVVCVLDATNLERNLVLTLEMLELGLPVIVALTMVDRAERMGIVVEARRLSRLLGVPVIAVRARTGEGVEQLVRLLQRPERNATPPASANDLFARASEIAHAVVHDPAPLRETLTDRIDAVLTHPVSGPVFFISVLFLVFQAIFAWAEPLMAAVEGVVGWSAQLVRSALPDGWFAGLLADGVIGGVGAVLVFLPQILLLFLFVGFLEDTGYMARVSLLADRMMARVGLGGQSVIPLVSGFACAVPAIMATRGIQHPGQRLITMLILPLISCSARLPIYTLLIAALVPSTLMVGWFGAQGIVLFGIYVVATAVALAASFILGRILRKEAPPLLALELPPYRVPAPLHLTHRVCERGLVFVRDAGKIILLTTMVLWFLAAYPQSPPAQGHREGIVTVAETGPAGQHDALENSYVARIGRVLEPVMQPLGFDWKITAGIITAFAARETLVSTLATLYNVSGEEGTLAEKMKADRYPGTERPVFTPLVAVSLLVFFVFACQCMATLAVLRRETGGWTWPVAVWVTTALLAYLSALLVFQTGLALGLG
jgi:ferrous iron transport protein B